MGSLFRKGWDNSIHYGSGGLLMLRIGKWPWLWEATLLMWRILIGLLITRYWQAEVWTTQSMSGTWAMNLHLIHSFHHFSAVHLFQMETSRINALVLMLHLLLIWKALCHQHLAWHLLGFLSCNADDPQHSGVLILCSLNAKLPSHQPWHLTTCERAATELTWSNWSMSQ